MYYAVFLFEQAGIGSTQSALLANGIQGLVLNVFVWPNMYWMDTWGRRRPAILGGIGMGIAMLIIGTLMGTLGKYLPTLWFVATRLSLTCRTRKPALGCPTSQNTVLILHKGCWLHHNRICVRVCRLLFAVLGMRRLGVSK